MNLTTLNSSTFKFGRHEFVNSNPEMAIPLLIALGLGTVIGTFGNVLILLGVARAKDLQNMESVFIVNLACSDLYVTALADPMSITAKLEGEDFFERIPGLCRAIACMCTISCVNSLMSISALSFNRFIYICHNKYYKKIFTVRSCIFMCGVFYTIGIFLTMLNYLDIGDHTFDRKSLECIWDRMATYSYTVVFSIVLVWIPIVVIGLSYLKIFLRVKASRQRIHQSRLRTSTSSSNFASSFQLCKTMFIIYIVFATCWAPYALIIVVDHDDSFDYAPHLYIVVWAHMHPSLNWLVYYFTNMKFQRAFDSILFITRCRRRVEVEDVVVTQTTENSLKPPKRVHSTKESAGM
ncbi:melatonin receptor type 1B-B-like [Gigantopelta aegis]|uniref:melatonin receptor type 1B-B-like n=1 Tax=Gigantopelta aegis TaxID=1735272 RepID=UPI001B88DD8D|nr:melatonin receptor type 1B-B-like [Gigantopelta aegis]